jgi:hypothetical protein
MVRSPLRKPGRKDSRAESVYVKVTGVMEIIEELGNFQLGIEGIFGEL